MWKRPWAQWRTGRPPLCFITPSRSAPGGLGFSSWLPPIWMRSCSSRPANALRWICSARPGRDLKGQAQAGQGFDLAHFTLDWDRQQATCPEGQTRLRGSPVIAKAKCGIRVIKINFSSKDCRRCPSCALCIRSKKQYIRRVLTVRPRAQHEALYQARVREKTAAFTAPYAQRAGSEGTLSRAVRTRAIRRSRYVGLATTPLQPVLTATALNVLRLGEGLAAVPRATPRRSPFARFMAQQAA